MLGAHVKNIYSKIAKLQSQIQQHCMYPHTPENNRSDTVQLLALEFDPDIDSENQPTSTSNSSTNNNQQQQADLNIIDANNCEAKNTQTQNQQFEINWPDTPTVQIPRVSSTVPDQPPEVQYLRRASTKASPKEDILDIEEDKHGQQNTEHHHLITCHNTPGK